MALIRCSECGRMISDKAPACVGCGAPTSPIAGFTIAPQQDKSPPPTSRQLFRRAVLSAAALGVGALWAGMTQHAQTLVGRISGTLAALLVIAGLCGLMATLLAQFTAHRDRPK